MSNYHRIRLAVVGAGRWGTRHIATLNDLRERVQLRYVVSSNPDTQKLVADDCEVVPTWRDALTPNHIDAAVLAVPPTLHRELCLHCIGVGLPVLVEKPLALSLSAARDIQLSAEREGSLVMVNHTHLFSPAWEGLRAHAAPIGPDAHVVSRGGSWGPFRRPATALWDYGPHDISMCLDLFDELPYYVGAEEYEQLVDGGPAANIGIRLEFPKGGSADIRVGNLFQEKQRSFELRLTDTVLRYDDQASDKLRVQSAQGDWNSIDISGERPLTRVLSKFVEGIHRQDHYCESLNLGVKVVDVLEQAESAILGNARAGESARLSAPTETRRG